MIRHACLATVGLDRGKKNTNDGFCFAAISKVRDSDDTDLMTDVFADLFGKRGVVSISQCPLTVPPGLNMHVYVHVQVICVAHSSVSIDGQPSDDSKTYWVALVKDLDQKGYFIRTVDKEVSCSWSG